jgi:hypothetical protein
VKRRGARRSGELQCVEERSDELCGGALSSGAARREAASCVEKRSGEERRDAGRCVEVRSEAHGRSLMAEHLQPDHRIDPLQRPPDPFVTSCVQLAVVFGTEGYGEVISRTRTHGGRLREHQVVGMHTSPATDKTRPLSHRRQSCL